MYIWNAIKRINMAIDPKELEFNKNEDEMRLKISKMEQELAKIYKGGGEKRIAALHEKGKMTAWNCQLWPRCRPTIRSWCFCWLRYVQRTWRLSFRRRCSDDWIRFKKAMYCSCKRRNR